ncbi:MAG TPA: hypothetical protein VLB44_12165, partial [Kofleriaceae bacterium]|nr:hypothetical protein [Kofleriaceae bacterium]
MRVVALALIALTSVARADTTVAVIVSGPEVFKKETSDVSEAWFKAHSLAITKSPLKKDGLNTLLNCLVISDMACARGVIEARATADNIIAISG